MLLTEGGNYLKDIQNTKGDFGYQINKVGVSNVLYPITIKIKDGSLLNTIGKFTMAVSLDKHLKGINMSRLPILLSEFAEKNWIASNIKNDIYTLLKAMMDKMESDYAYVETEFDFFLKKKAPVSEYEGTMPYKCRVEADYNNLDNSYDYILNVEVPVTTLCPCSKAISDYSAHNQRGYVQVGIRFDDKIYIEDIINIVEGSASCEIYPILKRVDEKYVTEKAYENPRFVEDIVRLVSEKLNEDDRIKWFKVSSRHQESIHAHDAFACIEITKNK